MSARADLKLQVAAQLAAAYAYRFDGTNKYGGPGEKSDGDKLADLAYEAADSLMAKYDAEVKKGAANA